MLDVIIFEWVGIIIVILVYFKYIIISFIIAYLFINNFYEVLLKYNKFNVGKHNKYEYLVLKMSFSLTEKSSYFNK